MEVQSLSVCVPSGCPNRCPFCVSRMHTEEYENRIEKAFYHYGIYKQDFIRRLEFARDNGCNTAILTGSGEPMINHSFLKDFASFNQALQSPFRWIELQTSGIGLDESALGFLRGTVGVSTISLSLSFLFDYKVNAFINKTPEKLIVNIEEVCSRTIHHGFNLRLSLNLTDEYERYGRDFGHGNSELIAAIFGQASSLKASQLTFRQLYVSGDPNNEQNKWIAEHAASQTLVDDIKQFVKDNGKPLEVLPFGATRYSVKGISVVIDEDCMGTMPKQAIKFLILRPDCKLYTKWDDKGSLLF